MTTSENLAFESGVLVEKMCIKHNLPFYKAIVYSFAGLELLARSNNLHIGEVRASVQSLLEQLHREQSNEDNS